MEPKETTEQVAQVVVPSAEPVMVTPPESHEGRRMKIVQRVFLGLGAVVLLVVGGVSLLTYSPASEAAPTVRWEPASLYASLAAGESTTTTASFVPTANATNVSVWVVPALAPYVSVSPTSFASVQKGINYQVTVNVAASSTAPLGVYEGTVHLRQGKKTLAVPLPMIVEVVWPTFDSETYNISFAFPDFGQDLTASLVEVYDDDFFIDISAPSTDLTSPPLSQYRVRFLTSDTPTTLSSWFLSNVDPSGTLVAYGTFSWNLLQNGMEVYVLQGPVPDNYPGDPISSWIYGVSPTGHTIVIVSVSNDHDLFFSVDSDASIVRSLLIMMESITAP